MLDYVLQQHSGQKVQMTGYCYGAKPITLLVEQHGYASTLR